MSIHQDCKTLLTLKNSGVLRTYKWLIDLEMSLPWLQVEASIDTVPPELAHLCHPNCFPSCVDWKLEDGVWVKEQTAGSFLRSGPWYENVTLRPTYCDLSNHDYNPGRIEIFSQWGGTLIAFMEEFGISPTWEDSEGLEAIEDYYKWIKSKLKHCNDLIDWAYSRRR